MRRFDIEADELEERAFDLVHCRALLLHLSDPVAALGKLAAAVRADGWLLVEDADFSSFGAVDSGHHRAAGFDRTVHDLLDGFAARKYMDPWFGARLRALADGLGLTERGHEALAFRRRGASAEATLFRHSFELHREWLLRDGVVSAADLDACLATLDDPSFEFVDSLNVAVWGRRPGQPYLG